MWGSWKACWKVHASFAFYPLSSPLLSAWDTDINLKMKYSSFKDEEINHALRMVGWKARKSLDSCCHHESAWPVLFPAPCFFPCEKTNKQNLFFCRGDNKTICINCVPIIGNQGVRQNDIGWFWFYQINWSIHFGQIKKTKQKNLSTQQNKSVLWSLHWAASSDAFLFQSLATLCEVGWESLSKGIYLTFQDLSVVEKVQQRAPCNHQWLHVSFHFSILTALPCVFFPPDNGSLILPGFQGRLEQNVMLITWTMLFPDHAIFFFLYHSFSILIVLFFLKILYY